LAARGFGTKLIDLFASPDLGGHVERAFAEDGVSVELRFPLQPRRRGEQMRPGHAQNVPRIDLTVLIVEDEPLIALDVEAMLERRGARIVGPAATVREALSLLQSERPDVALLDFSLKDGLVTPVAEALRARDIPFVLSSAHKNAELAAVSVLTDAPKVGKPVSESRLIAALIEVAAQ
jgi:two-component system, response regulator PdtaR